VSTISLVLQNTAVEVDTVAHNSHEPIHSDDELQCQPQVINDLTTAGIVQ